MGSSVGMNRVKGFHVSAAAKAEKETKTPDNGEAATRGSQINAVNMVKPSQ